VAYSMTLLSSNRVCSWPGSFTFQMGNVLGILKEGMTYSCLSQCVELGNEEYSWKG
jgi:hypothetical protein